MDIKVITVHGEEVLCDPALLEYCLNQQGYTRNGGFAASIAKLLVQVAQQARNAQKAYYDARKKAEGNIALQHLLRQSMDAEKRLDDLLARAATGLEKIDAYKAYNVAKNG